MNTFFFPSALCLFMLVSLRGGECNVWVAVRNYLSWLFVLAF